MAKRASQAGDARTTDRTSARRPGTEVSTCGKRRRWTAEQKHQIVAEGMEPDVSAAMVARKHGISTGQFYAWRQQLLLRGALGGGADTMPSLAGVDVTTTAPRLEPAIPAPPESGTPATAAALVLPVQPDDRIGVTGQMVWQDGWTRIAALSTLLRPIVRAYSTVRSPHERIAVRRTDPVTPRRLAR